MTSTATHVGSSFVPRVTSMVGAEELKLMSRSRIGKDQARGKRPRSRVKRSLSGWLAHRYELWNPVPRRIGCSGRVSCSTG